MEATTPTPVCPILHLNGTARTELLAMRQEVRSALHGVEMRLSTMTPHMRDYYPVEGLYSAAAAQHERRMRTVLSLIEDIEAEINQLYQTY